MADDAVTVDGKLTNIRQSSRNKYFEAIEQPGKTEHAVSRDLAGAGPN